MNRPAHFAAAAVLGTAACLAQAATVYTSEAAFVAAAGAPLSFQSFETVQSSSPTQYNFGDVSFSCTGTSYCPGFFGVSGAIVQDGAQAVFFASPDSATFTFTTAISAFGIWIGGAGDVAPITLTATLNNGTSAAALTNYSSPGLTTWQYFGILTATPFTALTLSPNNAGDGIFFDALRYRVAAQVSPVPEPAGTWLLGVAAAAWLAARRKRARR